LRSILNAVVIFSVGLVGPVQVICAQEVNAYLGFGSAHDSSSDLQINTFGDGTLYKTPTLGGLFMTFGATVFINKHVGVGAELSWKASQGDYAGLKYRPLFYSFDSIFRPARGSTKRFEPEFRAGLGGERVSYSFDDQQSCDQVPGCPASTHFQVHLASAARWYLTDHLFLRPALDVHYVNNYFEFGSNWVPRYSVGIGYDLGR
jgi:hypothetical protein